MPLEEWRKVKTQRTFCCRLFEVHVEEALSPRTGRPHDFYVIKTGDWVGIIPLTPDREVLLVRQFRHGSKSFSLEIPGGLVEGDDPEEAARRELREETGYEAEGLELLGVLRPQPAIFDNRYFTFLALGVKEVGRPILDEGEDLELVKVPLEEIPALMARGEIDHALVFASFQLLGLRRPELWRAGLCSLRPLG